MVIEYVIAGALLTFWITLIHYSSKKSVEQERIDELIDEIKSSALSTHAVDVETADIEQKAHPSVSDELIEAFESGDIDKTELKKLSRITEKTHQNKWLEHLRDGNVNTKFINYLFWWFVEQDKYELNVSPDPHPIAMELSQSDD